MTATICRDCPTPLRRSTTGYCVPCGNRRRANDPEFRAKQKAGLARKWADPQYRERMRLSARRWALYMAQDPDISARRRELGRQTVRQNLYSPDVRARTLKAVRERSGPTQSANRIAWCPEEYRDLYWYLRRTKRLSLAECKEAIANQAKADFTKLSPFERQERALANGAQLVANDSGPMFGDVLKVAQA